MQHILCISDQHIRQHIQGEGFIQTQDDVFDLSQLWLGPRPHLEEDERFKQIIPYVVLTYQNQVAVYQRTKQGGESRLHHMNSIGFGGHIDAFDLAYDQAGRIDLDQTIATSAQREIDEELVVPEIIQKSRLGYIIDNSNPVGRVHIGVVERWELSDNQVHSNEDEIKVLGLFAAQDIQSMPDAMENWSEHIIKAW